MVKSSARSNVRSLSVALMGVFYCAISIAATDSDLGVASGQVYNRPLEDSLNTNQTQRVRIPVTLKSWNEVNSIDAIGKPSKTKISGHPVNQVLRARIERSNDFYLGDWRIQTTPVRWLKRSNQYQVRLEVFRRLGENGQIEETLGSVVLTGLLEKQSDGLFILNGTARRLFRDTNGQPILDFDAGNHAPTEKATAISRK